MTETLISVDLDWLNDKDHPTDKIKNLLQHIPQDIPAIITIEHHQFLPHLRRWIKSEKVPIPFNIINIDEHHDFYVNPPPYGPSGTKINCGNWGYRLPTKWYRKLTWVTNRYSENTDWNYAQGWLKERNITASIRNKHRLSQFRNKIIAAVFCVSPDYLKGKALNDITFIIEIVARHFNTKRAPTRIRSKNTTSVDGWRIAPRPSMVVENVVMA